MNQDKNDELKKSNRFIFSDEFYNRLDNNQIEKKISVDEPEISSDNFQGLNMNNHQGHSIAPIVDINDSKVDCDNPLLLNSKIENTSSNFSSTLIDKIQKRNPNLEINNFNANTRTNTVLERKIVEEGNPMENSSVENSDFYLEPFQEKNIYRAKRNPIWIRNDILNDEQQIETFASIPQQNSLSNSYEIELQPEIINIDEQLQKEAITNNLFSQQKRDYEQASSNFPIIKSNLLEELKEKEKVTGRISILARYGEDFCNKDYITNPAIGRENEIKQLNLILLTPEKSAILVGKPGIGKTSIVEGLAYQLQRNNVPDVLKGYVIVSIKTTSLLGTLPTGETKLQTLIDELKELDKVILFIDEIHMLMGATNESSLDFANMFKESLGRGSIKMIGATTNDEYERYVLRDKAFVRRFQRVDVEEPTREQTIQILMGTLPKIEKNAGVKLKYSKYVQSEIMAFIVDITTEYKRVYGIGSRYPDICLTLLAQAFSQTVFENRSEVTIYDIRNAIENSKNIYPDVIHKELINFDNKFLKFEQEDD